MKIYQEVTEWKGVTYRQPNHVYLMDGDRAYAYSRWGEGKPEYFKNPSRLDKRGRKFIEVKKNPWGFNLKIRSAEEKPAGKTWEVQGSKGNTYTVSLLDGRWSCTCPGATFRGSCKHIVEKQSA
jgi:hypothetical protein